MKRILNLLRQDLTLVTRDSILVYVLVAPILFAVAVRLFLPGIGEMLPTVVVTADAPELVREELAAYLEVEVASDRRAVESRVRANDDAAGVLVEPDGSYRLILQGNEGHELTEAFRAVLASMEGVEVPVAFELTRLEGSGPQTTEYVAAVVLLLSTLIGGMLAGFTMVDDRGSGAIRALAVSPLRLWQYLTEKSLFILAFSLLAGVTASLIMVGTAINYGLLVASLAIGLSVPLVLAITLGAFADDQIAAIGMAKITMPVYLTPPVLAIFIPQAWHGFFYPFPNYWLFAALRGVFVGETGPVGVLPSALLALAGGVVATLIFGGVLRKRFNLR